MQRDNWYMRSYVPWAIRHQPYSHIVNFGSVVVGLALIFVWFWWLFVYDLGDSSYGTGSPRVVALAAASVYVGRRRARG